MLLVGAVTLWKKHNHMLNTIMILLETICVDRNKMYFLHFSKNGLSGAYYWSVAI